MKTLGQPMKTLENLGKSSRFNNLFWLTGAGGQRYVWRLRRPAFELDEGFGDVMSKEGRGGAVGGLCFSGFMVYGL